MDNSPRAVIDSLLPATEQVVIAPRRKCSAGAGPAPVPSAGGGGRTGRLVVRLDRFRSRPANSWDPRGQTAARRRAEVPSLFTEPTMFARLFRRRTARTTHA